MYKRVRESMEFSVEEFAEQLGVSPDDVRDWESGECQPGADVRNMFAALDMKLRVFRKLKEAVKDLSIDAGLAGHLKDIRDLIHRDDQGRLDMAMDDVLVEHLTLAVDDYFRKHGISPETISRQELARHIYDHIKFLF